VHPHAHAHGAERWSHAGVGKGHAAHIAKAPRLVLFLLGFARRRPVAVFATIFPAAILVFGLVSVFGAFSAEATNRSLLGR
jgi:hypothetical protein